MYVCVCARTYARECELGAVSVMANVNERESESQLLVNQVICPIYFIFLNIFFFNPVSIN